MRAFEAHGWRHLRALTLQSGRSLALLFRARSVRSRLSRRELRALAQNGQGNRAETAARLLGVDITSIVWGRRSGSPRKRDATGTRIERLNLARSLRRRSGSIWSRTRAFPTASVRAIYDRREWFAFILAHPLPPPPRPRDNDDV